MLIFGGGKKNKSLASCFRFPNVSSLLVPSCGQKTDCKAGFFSRWCQPNKRCRALVKPLTASPQAAPPLTGLLNPIRASIVMRFWEVSTSPRQEGSEDLKLLLRFEIKATQVTKSLLLQHASSAQAALLFCTEQPRHRHFGSMMFQARL